VLVHAVVHRGCDEQRALGGQRGGGEQVVGQPGGELGDRVGRGGRDDEDLSVAQELQMADRLVIGQRLIGEGSPHGVASELADQHRRPRQSGERGLPNEPPAGLGLDHPDRMPSPRGQPHQLESLVSSDPPADAKQYPCHLPTGCRAQAPTTQALPPALPSSACTEPYASGSRGQAIQGRRERIREC
jgi:hypothetical protein